MIDDAMDQKWETARSYETALTVLDRIRTFCIEAQDAVRWFDSELCRQCSSDPVTGTVPPRTGSALGDPAMTRECLAMMRELSEVSTVLKRHREYLHARYHSLAQEAERVAKLDWAWSGVRWRPECSIEEAESALQTVRGDGPIGDADERTRLREAGSVLARDLRLLRVHLAVEQNRVKREGRERHSGAPLSEGETLGGRRMFLNGKPVHAGDRLSLLTRWGWIDGRFESGDGGAPLICCRPHPGSNTEVCIPLTHEARMAWPNRG